MVSTSAIRFAFCFGLCSTISVAKTDTPPRNHSCKESDKGHLRSMKSIKDNSGTVLVEFKKDCRDHICIVRAQLADKTNIASFPLDSHRCFTIRKEVKEFDAETKPQGCARHSTLEYQYVRLNDDVWTASTLVFETVQVDKSDGRVCSQPDSNDGPALATFVRVYEVTPQTIVYVYELDGYRTIQESISAKAKYISDLRKKPTSAQLQRAIEKSSFAELVRQEEAHGFIERPKTAETFFRAGKLGNGKMCCRRNR